MNIDYNAVIEVLKSFLNNEKIEILGISVGEERQVKDAIRNLLTAYEKEKEANKRLDKEAQGYLEELAGDGSMNIRRIQELEAELEKEKEKNKRAEELYMQHNQMIIDILKECDYMIKNRYYMNDIAIRQYAEKIKDIAKYYIKEPEWIEIEEE